MLEPSIVTNDIEQLQKYGFSLEMINAFRNQKISKLYPFQKKALDDGLSVAMSFFIATPSGSGKTLIADFAILSTILFRKRKAIYLVPLKALATEKTFHYTKLFHKFGIRVECAIGDMDISMTSLKRCDVLIATYEKFDSYLRMQSENSWLHSIGCIVIDEVHLLGDNHRGLRLESLIIRIYQSLSHIQMIFLSATISNVEDVFEWFKFLENKYHHKNIQLISFDKRPIPLKYHFLINPERNLQIKELCEKALCSNQQLLVFTNSRRDAEQLVDFLITQLSNTHIGKNILNLSKLISFHHAGLNAEERIQIEQKFLIGEILILISTTTLSAGINLPVHSVVIKDPKIYEQYERGLNSKTSCNDRYKKVPMDRNLFHQICGRAGRPGFDEAGFVYILCDSEDEHNWVNKYYFRNDGSKLKPKYEIIESSFPNNIDHLEEAILVCINHFSVISLFDLTNYFQDSFFYSKNHNKYIPVENMLGIVNFDIISFLKTYTDKKLLIFLKTIPTELLINSINPDSSLFISIEYGQFSQTAKEKVIFSQNLKENDFQSYLDDIFYTKRKEILTISCNNGISCSCGKSIPFGIKIPSNKSIQPEKVGCIHIFSFFLFYYYLNDCLLYNNQISNFKFDFDIDTLQKQDLKHYIQNMIHPALFRPSLLDVLKKNMLIKIHQSDEYIMQKYECSPLGLLSTRSYIIPRYASYIHKKFLNFFPENENQIIKFIFEIIKELVELEERKPFNCFYEIIHYRISEYSIETICQNLNQKENVSFLYSNDLLRLFEHITRFFRFIRDYIQLYYSNHKYTGLDLMYIRLKYGVKPDLIPWIEKFGDNNISNFRIFINLGFKLPEHLLNKSIDELIEMSGLSLEFCRQLQLKLK